MAAKHRTDEDLVAMRRARTHFRVAYEMGTPVWEADIEFHQAIAEASRNSVLPRVLAPVSDLLKNSRRATGTLPAAVELALDQHEEIAAAIEARASARARRAMTTHIESGMWALGELKYRAESADLSPVTKKTTANTKSYASAEFRAPSQLHSIPRPQRYVHRRAEAKMRSRT